MGKSPTPGYDVIANGAFEKRSEVEISMISFDTSERTKMHPLDNVSYANILQFQMRLGP